MAACDRQVHAAVSSERSSRTSRGPVPSWDANERHHHTGQGVMGLLDSVLEPDARLKMLWQIEAKEHSFTCCLDLVSPTILDAFYFDWAVVGTKPVCLPALGSCSRLSWGSATGGDWGVLLIVELLSHFCFHFVGLFSFGITSVLLASLFAPRASSLQLHASSATTVARALRGRRLHPWSRLLTGLRPLLLWELLQALRSFSLIPG